MLIKIYYIIKKRFILLAFKDQNTYIFKFKKKIIRIIIYIYI